MATYPPPTEIIPQFNSTDFNSALQESLTIAEADTRYLKYPISQGSETISGNLTVSGTLSAGASTLTSVATNTITGSGTIQVSPTTGINIADNLTSGSINIGRQDATSTSTLVNIASGNGQTGAINFGTGTGTKTITIGNDTATTTEIKGSTINATRLAVSGTLTAGTFSPATINCATLNSATATNQSVGGNLTTNNLALGNNISSGQINIGNGLSSGIIDIGKGTGGTITIANTNGICGTAVQICSGASVFNQSTCVIGKNSALSINNDTGSVNLSTTSTSSGTLTIANEAGSNRTINIGRNNAIAINNGTTSTVSITGTTNINTGGTATTAIGNNSASSIVNLFGTVNINSSGSQSTAIGNSTGTITMTGTVNMNTSSTSSLTVGNTTGTVRLLSANTYIQQDTFPLVQGTGALAGYYPIGYTIQATLGPANISDTTGTYSNIGSQAIPAVKGVYIISCGFTLTASGSDTLNNKAMILSLTSGTSDVPVNAFGAWEYYDEINDSIGGGGGRRYTGTLCGTYINSAGTSATIYLNGYGNTSGSATISCDAGLSITRVG